MPQWVEFMSGGAIIKPACLTLLDKETSRRESFLIFEFSLVWHNIVKNNVYGGVKLFFGKFVKN